MVANLLQMLLTCCLLASQKHNITSISVTKYVLRIIPDIIYFNIIIVSQCQYYHKHLKINVLFTFSSFVCLSSFLSIANGPIFVLELINPGVPYIVSSHTNLTRNLVTFSIVLSFILTSFYVLLDPGLKSKHLFSVLFMRFANNHWPV